MLRREDSNKLLKHLKVILFATGLSLLNPINVKAQEITHQEVIEENTENSEDDLGLFIIGTATICGIAIMISFPTLLTLSTTYINSPKKEEKSEKIKMIKLKDLKNK